ncbi:MAG: DUF4446 family protein [Candidatus Krumholzibacteriota bacterium]|nr:DUF4446 family protein [Candidatus Krumholzibacteriota bacterium]
MGWNAYIEAHVDLLTVAALVIALLSLAAAIVLLGQVRRLRRPYRSMAALCEKKGAEKALEELLKGVDENRALLGEQSGRLAGIAARLEGSFSGAGLVKYNAFEDVGGNQSYSLCLLTGERNGVILTNLVGRNATRGYALDVSGGTPSRDLSDEERTALETATKAVGG